MYNRRFTPENIIHIEDNEVFVFGSNLAGSHGGGAARLAYNRFGAVWGQGVGLQGQSYAIPTMHGGVDAIKPYVDEFISFTKLHPELIFLVTKIGCGIAGFKDEEIAPLFEAAIDVENIILPKSFVCVISTAERYAAEMSTMKFKAVRIKFFREDEEKLKSMTGEEKNMFMQKIREEHRYTVIRDED